VLPNATAAEAARCAERIRSAASRIDIGDRNRAPLKITVSVGVAAFPDDGTEVSSLVAAADQALYQAKLWRNMALTSPSATGSPPPDDDLPALDGPPVQVATAMAASVDSASSATAHHSFAVAARATMIASALGLPADGRRAVRIAGLVHDLGKIGVSREVAAKGDDLPPEERRMLQCHADLGARVLRHLGVPDPIPEIVRHHHERYDGTGYPCGLEGKAIPLGARILAVAEAFVLLTWPRESGPPISAAEALSRIERESGRAFDPDIASALFRILPGTGNALSTPAVEPRPAPETVAV
jgi:putative nucleotidyltransferase with HDIG domain